MLLAAALVEPQQFVPATIELVIAHRIEIQPDEVHCLDGRLIEKQAGDKRRRTDQVACREHHMVGISRPQCFDRRRKIGGAARWHLNRCVGRSRMRDGLAGGLQIAMKIVERDQRDLDRFRNILCPEDR